MCFSFFELQPLSLVSDKRNNIKGCRHLKNLKVTKNLSFIALGISAVGRNFEVSKEP
jgi:hypothetical protein